MQPVWDTPGFRQAAGTALRPGGIELTKHALETARRRGLVPLHGVAADFGCGPGASVALLASFGFTAIGLERSIKTETQPENAAFLCADIHTPPLRRSSVDLILLECVLSVVENPLTVLQEAYAVLKTGGICLIADLCRNDTDTDTHNSMKGLSCAAGSRTKTAWRTLFTQAGLTLVHEEQHDRALRELAARLIWYADTCLCTGHTRGLGYSLWIVQKRAGSQPEDSCE